MSIEGQPVAAKGGCFDIMGRSSACHTYVYASDGSAYEKSGRPLERAVQSPQRGSDGG
jgi:hypothetical protein